jgi:glyoxylase-like metal-dependent hydrolase (beta-lactamase superfamily II)
MNIQIFTFNAFQENTYLLIGQTGHCIIIDPGMTDPEEDQVLFSYIQSNQLKPSMVLNTHCHIDHIMGVQACLDQYHIPFLAHEKELAVIDRGGSSALNWNIPFRGCPYPDRHIDEGEIIDLDGFRLEVLFVPGHCPGHLAFVNRSSKFVVGGDVLFKGSVGRVDLPGCNKQDLIDSVQQKMYALPDDFAVLPGHGEMTTIGAEKKTNHFIRSTDVSF